MFANRRHVAFAAVIALQLAILIAIPVRKVLARWGGTQITLQTRPVDPYDLLSGYYVTLGYEVETHADWGKVPPPPNSRVWVTVTRGDPVWTHVSTTVEKPAPRPDTVSVAADWNGYSLQLAGADRLYIPETKRQEIEDLMAETQRKALVDMAVGSDGEPAVIRLRVKGHSYGD